MFVSGLCYPRQAYVKHFKELKMPTDEEVNKNLSLLSISHLLTTHGILRAISITNFYRSNQGSKGLTLFSSSDQVDKHLKILTLHNNNIKDLISYTKTLNQTIRLLQINKMKFTSSSICNRLPRSIKLTISKWVSSITK